MNVQNSKDYLEQILPNFTITVEENYKGKPNNRYEFKKAGFEKPAAVLLAQNLRIEKNMLDDLAVAVNKKFNEAPPEIADEPVAEQQAVEPEMQPETKEFKEKQPSSTEFALYRAAKAVVAEFEKSYPMT